MVLSQFSRTISAITTKVMQNCVPLGIVLLFLSVGNVSSHEIELWDNDLIRLPRNCYLEREGVNCYPRTGIFVHDELQFIFLNISAADRHFNAKSEEYLPTPVALVRIIYRQEQFPRLELGFNSNMAVGTANVRRKAWTGWRNNYNYNKYIELTILKKIYKSNLFHAEFPTMEFFDFSSPMFGSKERWLSSFVVQEDDNFITSSLLDSILQSLRHTSIEVLDIPGCIPGHQNHPFLLRDMPLLRHLDISNNHIEELDNNTFIGTPEIHRLTLRSNFLREIPRVLHRLPKLKYLDISYSEILLHEHNILHLNNSFQNLEVLKMSGTTFDFNLKDLSVLGNLTHLHLDECYVYYNLEIDTFRKFPRLQYLNLSHVDFLYKNRKNFQALTNLTALDISRNDVKSLPRFYISSVTYLNISYSNINSLTELRLQIDAVEYLDLSHNNVSEWNDVPRFWANVVEIRLQFNNINFFSINMTKSLRYVQRIYLGNNPFNCLNCETKYFQFWINKTQPKILDLNKTLCSDGNIPLVTVTNSYLESCIIESTENVTHNTTESSTSSSSQIMWLTSGLPVVVVLTLVVIIEIRRRYLRNRDKAKLVYMEYLDKIMNHPVESSPTKKKEYIFDAFVCYSHKNRKFVIRTLVPFLENGKEKFQLCLHERDFPLGTDVIENIVRAVEGSRKVIMIISNAYVRSKWCKYELKLTNHIMIEDNTHPLIMVQIETLDEFFVPRHLSEHLKTKTYLEWPQDDTDTTRAKYQRLRKALAPSLYQQSRDAAECSSIPMEPNDLELVPVNSVDRLINDVSQNAYPAM